MNERETIFLMYEQGETIGCISETLERSKSTISRELHRNSNKDGVYSPSTAHEEYKRRKQLCGRHRTLDKDSEYGIRNRPPVRNFRPLYASKKSTKCENNRPIV